MDVHDLKKLMGELSQFGSTVTDTICPKEAKKHFRNALKEALLGIIEILDNYEDEVIEKTEKKCHKIDITD